MEEILKRRIMALPMTLVFVSVLCSFETAQGLENDYSAEREMIFDKIFAQEKRDQEHRSLIQNLQEQMSSQQIDLKIQFSSQQAYIEKLETRLSAYDKTTHELLPLSDQHQALGCSDDTIHLSCTNGSLITVTNAYYGQYLQTTPCSGDCCAPNPQWDCTETMAENDAEDWACLKYTCDNKTACNYVYEGALINECESGYIADYMLIYYSCSPVDDNDYAAFTAHAASSRSYQGYDIVLFDSVITNTGNHYSGETSTFVCPFEGVFSFSVSFYSSGSSLYLDIMRDEEQVIRGVADYIYSEITHGMSTVVIECKAGQFVWTRCYSFPGDMYGGSDYQSHFTGFALHRFS